MLFYEENMSNLFTLGCSLTWGMGWKELLAERHDLNLVSSAMFAGSNDLQLRRIHSYIVNNQINNDDIIIWQLTSTARSSFRVIDPTWIASLDNVQREDEDAVYYIDAPKNYFDGQIHKDVLSNHPMIIKYSSYYNAYAMLEEILSTIILLNKSYKILVFVGWEGALSEDPNNYNNVMRLLDKNKVPHLTESYLSWAIRTHQPLSDDLHPTMDASEIYGETVLIPKLQELGWIQ